MAISDIVTKITKELRAIGDARLHALIADGRLKCGTEPIAERFADVGVLMQGIEAGNSDALACGHALLIAAGPPGASLSVARLVLEAPELHKDEYLVLFCLRDLCTSSAPDDLDAVLPFVITRRWAGAMVPLEASPVSDVVERVLAFLETHPPELAPESVCWPTVADAPVHEPVPEAFMPASVLSRLCERAAEASRQRIRALLLLWLDRALAPNLRGVSAGTLLASFDEKERLAQLIEDDHRGVRDVAYLAATLLDPCAVYERLEPLLSGSGFPMGADLRRFTSLIDTLRELTVRRGQAAWVEREPRLLRALARIWRSWGNTHRTYLDVEAILKSVPQELLTTLLAVPHAEQRRTSGPALKEEWLARWQGGEHGQVWAEIVACELDFGSEERMAHARTVAEWTMEAVRRDLLTLEERLASAGHRLPKKTGVKKRRSKTQDRALDALLEHAGPIPLSLEAFFSVVGGVDFVPEDPAARGLLGLEVYELDPLLVFPVSTAKRQLKDWQELRAVRHPALVGPLWLLISIDAAAKAEMSGGQISIELPDGRADGWLTHTDLRLVDYLRFAILERGGLLGLEPGRSDAARALLAELTTGLAPF